MWMMPLHLHVNQKSDYDDDEQTNSHILQKNSHILLISRFICSFSFSQMKISVTDFCHILLISRFICSFSFSKMKISVTDFSAPIGASVLKFCVHLKVGKVYCVNENYDANPHFAYFFNFSFFPSVTLI